MGKTIIKIKKCDNYKEECVDLRVKKGTKASELYMAAASIILEVSNFNKDSIQKALKNVEGLVQNMETEVQRKNDSEAT